MNTSAPRQNQYEIILRPLAPIIPLKAVSREEIKPKKKVTKAKPQPTAPIIYEKPIYKSKKYDLL